METTAPAKTLNIISMEALLDQIAARVQSKQASSAYTLLLGSGFSDPVIPLTSRLLDDIAWWLLRPDPSAPFSDRPGNDQKIERREKELWKTVYQDCGRSFELSDGGLPDMTSNDNVRNAYFAVMSPQASRGLNSSTLRRNFLRDIVRRTGRKNNGAHIFLASILQKQDESLSAPFCRTIFTTNFDLLLQHSLQLVNKHYFVSDRPEDLESLEEESLDAIHLIYTHGSIHRYGLNTKEDLKKVAKRNGGSLMPFFSGHGVIVVGYSGWNDPTMEILKSCKQFDGTLYWCDIHSADDAEKNLRKDVGRFISEHRDNVFYVPIAGADDLMQKIHARLGFGLLPDFILNPLEHFLSKISLIDASGIKTPSAAAGLSETSAAGKAKKTKQKNIPVHNVHDILQRTIQGLKTTVDYFKLVETDPEKIQTSDIHPVVGRRMMNKAIGEYLTGNIDTAIGLWDNVLLIPDIPADIKTQTLINRASAYAEKGDFDKEILDYSDVIDDPASPEDQKTRALLNRGVAFGEKGETDLEIRDYSLIIDDPIAPADQKLKALLNRGQAYGEKGETDLEIRDYSAFLNDPAAPADQKARAVLTRGLVYGKKGETDLEIRDYSAFLDDPAAPAGQKPRVFFMRGIAYGQKGETGKEIGDYSAVIGDPASPPEQKAKALLNRGITYGQQRELDKAIGDYSAIIDDPAAPSDQKTRAFINLGMAHGQKGDTELSIQAYSAVIDDPAAPGDQKAKALFNRAITFGKKGELEKEILDYSAIIDNPDAPEDQKAKALFNRAITFGQKGELEKGIQDYSAVIDNASATQDQKIRAHVNRGLSLGKKGEPDLEILDYSAVIDDPVSPADQKARAHINRGVAYGKKGETDKRIQDYTSVIDDPACPPDQKVRALLNRAITYGQFGELDKGIEDYTALINDPAVLSDQKARALLNRGMAYGEKSESDKEIQDYSAVIDDPAAPQEQKILAHINRGAVYGQRGEIDKGILDYLAVAEDAATPPDQKAQAYGTLGWNSYLKNDIPACIENSKKALNFDENLLWARFNLGLCLLIQGSSREAKEHFVNACAKCTEVKELSDFMKELEKTLETRGSLQGGEYILRVFKKRLKELQSQPK